VYNHKEHTNTVCGRKFNILEQETWWHIQ